MVRLLGWGEQPKLGFSIDGLTLATRRNRLASKLQAKGRKLEMPQHNGVIATTRQTTWAMDLVEALEVETTCKIHRGPLTRTQPPEHMSWKTNAPLDHNVRMKKSSPWKSYSRQWQNSSHEKHQVPITPPLCKLLDDDSTQLL